MSASDNKAVIRISGAACDQLRVASSRCHVSLEDCARVALALFLRSDGDLQVIGIGDGDSAESAELDADSVLGDEALLFRALVAVREGGEPDDFPAVLSRYIGAGASLLVSECRYSHDLFAHLADLRESV